MGDGEAGKSRSPWQGIASCDRRYAGREQQVQRLEVAVSIVQAELQRLRLGAASEKVVEEARPMC